MTISPKPNLQLVYVSDVESSTNFYKILFEADPVFVTPRYVAFSAGGDALFAIWSGGETPDPSTPRFSEIGITLPTNQDVDNLFEKWKEISTIKVKKEPYTDVFGRTFMIEDPDGHIIRVSPVD